MSSSCETTSTASQRCCFRKREAVGTTQNAVDEGFLLDPVPRSQTEDRRIPCSGISVTLFPKHQCMWYLLSPIREHNCNLSIFISQQSKRYELVGNRAHSLEISVKIALLTQGQDQNLHDHLNSRKIQDQTSSCSALLLFQITTCCILKGSVKTELHFIFGLGFFLAVFFVCFRISMILGSCFAK